MGNNYIITIGREYGSGGFEIGKKLNAEEIYNLALRRYAEGSLSLENSETPRKAPIKAKRFTSQN